MTASSSSLPTSTSCDESQRHPSGRKFLTVLPYVAGVIVIGLYSHFLRPIWYDEMVFFVLAGLQNPAELVKVIYETTPSINQGQTGAYMVLVFSGLKTFGASLLSLRIVSIAFGILFMTTSLLYLRRQSISWSWQLIFLALLCGYPTLMLYVSEARVYIAFVALTTASLLYYSYDPDKRGGRTRVFGWLVVPLMSAMSPYAALYLPLLVAFGYLTSAKTGRSLSLRGLITWSNPKLVVVSVAVYVLLASTTWSRGTASFLFDPWEFVDRPLPMELLHHHLTPIVTEPQTLALWILVLGTAALFLVVTHSTQRAMMELKAPFLLLGLALSASLVISTLSLIRDFWILPRQWTASIALSAIGLTWACERIWCILRTRSSTAAISFHFAIAAVALASVFPLTQFQLGKWVTTVRHYPEEIPQSFTQLNLAQRLAAGESPSDKEWVRYAHINTVEGGSVWSEFGYYYRDRDWSEFFVVTDPNQLTIFD